MRWRKKDPARLTIVSNGRTFIDGKDITHQVSGVDISIHAGDANRATIYLAAPYDAIFYLAAPYVSVDLELDQFDIVTMDHND